MDRHDSLSIFSRYYTDEPFVDRFQTDRSMAVDVIIPIIHTNELWRANLTSIYREIPVNRLLLGDGGCIDGSTDVARQFPRVEVLNHRGFTSLGYSIRHLIEAVKTDWFVYLHSDVYLPSGWFEAMCARRVDFDWFECNQRITVMADYLIDVTGEPRAYSGSQMGRKAAFRDVLPKIDDDYLYRNEDIIIADLLTRTGFRYGKVGETFHFHQVMHKPSRWQRKIKQVDVHLDLGRDEDRRAAETYVFGIVKYMDPASAAPAIVHSVRATLDRLVTLNFESREALLARVGEMNPRWLAQLETSYSRDWLADRVIALAMIYRQHGVWITLKRAAVKLYRTAFPKSEARGLRRRTSVAAWLVALADRKRASGRWHERTAQRVISAANFYREHGGFATMKLAVSKMMRG